MDNRFLELMRIRTSSIPYMKEEELTQLRQDLDYYIKYFSRGEAHGYTKLFNSSVNGKLGAINGALLKVEGPPSGNSPSLIPKVRILGI